MLCIKLFVAFMNWTTNPDCLTLKHLACRNIAHTLIRCLPTRHCTAKLIVSLKILGSSCHIPTHVMGSVASWSNAGHPLSLLLAYLAFVLCVHGTNCLNKSLAVVFIVRFYKRINVLSFEQSIVYFN